MKRDPFFPPCRHEVDRLFDALIHTAWGGRQDPACWTPSADVSEEQGGYRLELDLPGVQAADVSITAQGRMLRIEGTRERHLSSGSGRHHLMERTCGRFVRTFRLPDDADPEGIRASLREGILTVRIPRSDDRRRR